MLKKLLRVGFPKKAALSALVIILVSILIPVLPVLAINEPDSSPAVNACYVYENCLEDGDAGVLIDYYLDYATLPDETATDSYLVTFVDTDGVTQLKSAAPYTFQDSGYGRGLVWIYFSAAEVTTYSLDSADIADYEIWLSGNPALAWTTVDAETAMTGSVADDGGVQTDETAESNSAAANDMTLLPAVPVVNDAYYFGGADKFDLLTINIGTQGDGTWEITWEYWDGSTWSALEDISDGTTAFEAATGNRDVSWTMSSDWVITTVDSITAYWVRARVSSYTAVVTQPKGTQSWINSKSDPPKTIAGIDSWSTVGDPSSLLAVRVLYYADLLELLWTLDLKQEIYGGGSTLTDTGESYFVNVIANLKTMAPDVFASSEADPVYNPLDYNTAFGATVTSGTATVAGSPVTLTEGSTSIDTGATTGTVIIDLADWTFGTITDDTGTVTGSPVDLTPGVNTVTVTAAGTFDVDVAHVDTITLKEDEISGTGFDLTTLATTFGMSRWFFSGLIWMLITLLVCAAVYRVEAKNGNPFGGEDSSGGKVILTVFSLMIIGGALLGLLSPLVAALLFIACGAFIGYVLFFRSDSLHKGFMFMLWMFVVVSFAGNYAAGSTAITATYLTADITDTETSSISVASTDGFPDSGVIVIGDEYIGYPSKTDTTFDETDVLGVTVNPIVRGMSSTEAVAHSEDDVVRTREAAILNASIDYKIAKIADTAGVMGFITFPAQLLDLIMTVFVLPLGFLGTDMAILAYIWMIVAVGMVVGFIMQLVGGRRV